MEKDESFEVSKVSLETLEELETLEKTGFSWGFGLQEGIMLTNVKTYDLHMTHI